MNLGPIVSNKGMRRRSGPFLDVIEERHVAHANALHAVVKGRGAYHVGPLARLNLNAQAAPTRRELLPSDTGTAALPQRFVSLPARSLETVHAVALAIEPIAAYKPEEVRRAHHPHAASAPPTTEAPRGILYHRYEAMRRDTSRPPRIIPPTSQNQPQIEQDLREYAQQCIELSDEDLSLRAASDPELRSLHQLRDALPQDPRGATHVRRNIWFVGVGRPGYGDDALGILIAQEMEKYLGEAVFVAENGTGSALAEAIERADLLIVVDAAERTRSAPSRGSRCRIDFLSSAALARCRLRDGTPVSGREPLRLGRAAGFFPRRIWIIAVAGTASPETRRCSGIALLGPRARADLAMDVQAWGIAAAIPGSTIMGRMRTASRYR